MFLAWSQAIDCCQHTDWLLKQYNNSKLKWIEKFRSISIDSTDDLCSRYSLLSDSREKLSTLAHYWNESTQDERFNHFQSFLSIISGKGKLSDVNESISVDMMSAMPLHNYEDLTRERISVWCDYFSNLSKSDKTQVLINIWNILNSEEQHAVITDLRFFMSQEMKQKNSIEKNISLDSELID